MSASLGVEALAWGSADVALVTVIFEDSVIRRKATEISTWGCLRNSDKK